MVLKKHGKNKEKMGFMERKLREKGREITMPVVKKVRDNEERGDDSEDIVVTAIWYRWGSKDIVVRAILYCWDRKSITV
ncbi:hypothetical protein ACLOJK_015116 [Asimina triloba]